MLRVNYSLLFWIAVLFTQGVAQPQWEPCQIPVTGVVTTLTAAPDGIIYAGMERGLYRSTDHGDTWERVDDSLQMRNIQAVVATSSVVIAATDSGLFRSTDKAATWSLVVDGHNYRDAMQLFIDTSSVPPSILLARYNGLFRSTDHGATWGSLWFADRTVLSITADAEGVLYAGTALHLHHGVHRSTDHGATWENINPSVGNVNALMVAKDNSLYVGTFDHVPTNSNVYRSVNQGNNWVEQGIQNSWVSSFAQGVNAEIIIGIQSANVFEGEQTFRGVLHSTDQGATWESLNVGLGSRDIRDLLVSDGVLYAATAVGVFRRNAQTSNVDDNVAATEITLSAYPNPTSGNVSLRFSAVAGSGELSIINAVGEKVVAGSIQTVDGHNTITLDASTLSEGLYFVQLNGKSLNGTGVVVVMR